MAVKWKGRFDRNGLAFVSSLFICLTLIAVAMGSQSINNQTKGVPSVEESNKVEKGSDNTSYSYSVTFGGVSFSAQTMTAQSAGVRKPKEEETGNEGTEYLPNIRGVRIKITDGILALFTTLLFFATLWLFFATDDLVAEAQESSKRQLRAYVGIVIGECHNLAVPGPVRIEIKNFGQSPAYDLVIESFLRIGQVSPIERTPVTSTSVLAPTADSEFDVFIDEVRPDDWVFDGSSEGPNALYAYGIIFYRDAFDENRETSFCFHIGEKQHVPHLGALCAKADGNIST